jgi:hypothetical protein
MKKGLLQFVFLCCAFAGFAQVTPNDSAVLGAGYTNDVFYSMQNGVVSATSGTNWHIAFSARNITPPAGFMKAVSISVNEGRGVKLYKSTQSDWNAFDTAGFKNWSNPHNSDTSWDVGAFNADRNNTNPFDFGWGTYNTSNNKVQGSTIFLLQITLGSGPSAVTSYKKIRIDELVNDSEWVFTTSNLDNSDSLQSSILKANYNGKLFAYHDVIAHTTTNREPAAPWDLLFTRYGTSVTQFGVTVFSTTTGVLHNPNITTAKVTGVPPQLATVAMASFKSNINTIGTDWKENPGPGQPNFLIHDSTAYFVRLPGSDYKLVFASFAGSSTGTITFNKSVVVPAPTDTFDDVILGNGYTNDVFYSMQNGVVSNTPGNNWHIAFSTRPAAPPFNVMRSATVLANEGRGVSIYKSTQNNWSTFDTAGYKSWANPHNSDTSWDVGAFNGDRTSNAFDFGWGTYNQQSHDVEGNVIFLVQVTTRVGSSNVTNFKKVRIEKLAFDTQWVFTSSNIDGSDSTYQTISRAAFTGKLFAYYNLNTKTVIDREPAQPWDLLFTRYGTFVTQFGVTAFSATTGAFHYPGVRSAKVTGNIDDSLKVSMASFSDNINTIGTDWKENPGPGQPNFIVHDSTAYFVRLTNAKQYKLVFKLFEGTSTGRIAFVVTPVEDVTPVGLQETANKNNTLHVYPNPASSFVTIETGTGSHQISLFDITGKLHRQTMGTGAVNVSLSGLDKGLYFIQVDGSKAARLVIE